MFAPLNQEVIKRLILHFHLKNCHVGRQIILNLHREKYWILNGWRTVTSVLSECAICKIFNSKNLEFSAVSLPENPVKGQVFFKSLALI